MVSLGHNELKSCVQEVQLPDSGRLAVYNLFLTKFIFLSTISNIFHWSNDIFKMGEYHTRCCDIPVINSLRLYSIEDLG